MKRVALLSCFLAAGVLPLAARAASPEAPRAPPPRQLHAPAPDAARALPPRQLHAPGVVRGPLRLDQRYRHDHYYPAAGFAVTTLPAGSVSVGWHDGNWFFHGGVWFRPVGPRFVVAAPPVGIPAPFLPPAVVPLWIGGAPYYYANRVYYAVAPEGYVVVPPPAGADVARSLPVPPAFIVYPRNGQSPEQSDADRAACNQWAATQPGAASDAVRFQLAFEACMDGRGYTVR